MHVLDDGLTSLSQGRLCDVRLGAINQGWHRGQGEGDMHVGSGARSEPERKIAIKAVTVRITYLNVWRY